MKKIQQALLSSALVLGSYQALALPFSGTDARSLAMGGTGVAAGSVVNASTFNPALLAAYREDEDFNLSLSFGFIARDEQGMIDTLDSFQNGPDLVGNFSNSTSAYQTAVTAAVNDPANLQLIIDDDFTAFQALPSVSGAATTLNNDAVALQTALNDFADKPIDLGATVGFNMTIPSESLGISLFVNSRIIGSGYVTDIDQDTTIITDVATTITSPTSISDLQAISDPFAGTSLQSSLVMTGGAVTEVGLAMATKIAGIAIGVTPKQLRIDTIEFIQGIDVADTDTALDNTGESFSDANFDVGLAMDLGVFKLGAVVKNMIPQEYAMVNSVIPGSRVVVEPQLRAGIAFDAGWATLTMDQDMSVNKGLVNTDDPVLNSLQESQYTSVGLEMDLALIQLRAGLRTDATGNSADVITAGIGFHFLFTLDLAVAASENSAEGIVQLGMRW
ncbi:MAG: conjugal transfer protein TraF [Gammaproteobacteria bacterium]|nr:conjugal transfer protein TraF [Gammaproteobacteria bacterium]